MTAPPRPRPAALGLILAIAIASGCASRPPSPPPVAPPAPAAASVKPGVNEEFLKPDLDVEQWTERFEREGREVYDHRHAIVEAVQLEAGMTVADVGAGSGLFTGLFAAEVGESGRVFAVDIAPRFVELIEERAREAGLRQVVGIVGDERSTRLPRESVDVAFICDTYHHFEFPAETLASIHQALRPNGQIVLIDFHRIPGRSSEWTLNHVRAGQEVFTAEIEAAGFRLEQELPLLEQNYVLRFRKTAR